MNIFSDEVRRDPFAIYEQMRTQAPAFYAPPPFDGWLIFDYETVKRVLNDHDAFSSAVPAPRNWFVFMDAPAHSKLRALIEEVLRYRSPFQWIMRTPRRDIELNGKTIPAGKLVLGMIGSANRDPKVFKDANRFDIRRDPNPHIAFGHGIHSCLGAALARMEARIALGDFLARVKNFERISNEPWEPRKALHVHGPAQLAIRLTSTS